MARRNFNDGQEVTFTDLNAVSSALEQLTLDRILPQLLRNQQSKVFGTGFKASYISATSVSVAAGVGVYYDSTQVSPEPLNRLLYALAASTQTIEAAHPSNNRVDIISIKAQLTTELSDTRKFKDAGSGSISNVSMVLQKDWTLDIVVTKGVEDGSAAVPTTPTGYLKLCEIAVTASTGVANQAAITDKRPRFSFDGYDATIGSSGYCSHATLAEALADPNIVSGMKIRIEGSETISTPVSITQSNLQLDFMPGVTFTRGGAATEALTLVGDGIRINGGRFASFSSGGDRGINISVGADYAICIGQRFNNCTADFLESSGTATILANVQE